MRQIKFRAWDTMYSKMHPSDDLALVLDGSKVLGFDNDLGHEVAGFGDVYGRSDRFILLQFTGLSDKNGKEIWEGDLLRDDRNVILEVKWGEGEWLAGKLALNANNFFEGKCEHLERIDNIYESPEKSK